MGKANNNIQLGYADMDEALSEMKSKMELFVSDCENVFITDISQLNDMNSYFTEYLVRILESVRDNDLISIAHDMDLYYGWIENNYIELQEKSKDNKT